MTDDKGPESDRAGLKKLQAKTVRKRAYFIDANYTVRNNKTYLSLVLKGKKTVKLFYQHDPYFIVDAPTEKIDELLAIKVSRKNGESTSPIKAEVIEKKISMKKKKMIKLYAAIPSDVPLLRAAVYYPSYENNIPFARRTVLDLHISPFDEVVYEREDKKREIKKIISFKSGHPKLKMMSFDIETYNPQGIPRMDKDPIIMLSYSTGLHSSKKEGVLTYKKAKHEYVKTVENEKEILVEFEKIVARQDPDILVAYNSANFDLPYIKERIKVLKEKISFGRFGNSIVPLRKGLIGGIRLDGRIHFDVYPVVKFFGFIGIIKTQKFTLDAVARDVLGNKKVDIKKEEIWKSWDKNDIDHLSGYSLVDAELTYQLGDRFLPTEIELSFVSKMPLFETTISTSGQLVENLLMYHATDREELIPSKPGGEEIEVRLEAPIEGAYVKIPAPGIYQNVAVLDFRGLYPSIIVSYNIDPQTLVEEGIDNAALANYYISPTNAHFSKKEVGLVPFVLNYLIDMRMTLKHELKKLDKDSEEYIRIAARSQALKILANSFYGYLGYARSRYYSRPCAESVTAWGRKHIMETMESAEKHGFSVLYSDTDSVFLIYNNKDDVIKFMKEINEKLPEKMELELEGFYPRAVFVSKKGADEKGAKKKYALLGEDGRIKIRGFELVRRDWSKVAKDTQLKVLEAILKEGSKEKAIKIIRDVVKQLQEGKVPFEDLVINTQLNKNPANYDILSPEVAAAKKLIQAGIKAEKGTMISYIIGKPKSGSSGKNISERSYPLELAKDYDPEYYIEHQIIPSVMKIMKELGYDEHSIRSGGKQKSLDEWFN